MLTRLKPTTTVRLSPPQQLAENPFRQLLSGGLLESKKARPIAPRVDSHLDTKAGHLDPIRSSATTIPVGFVFIFVHIKKRRAKMTRLTCSIFNGRDRDRTDDLYRVKVALIPTELRARGIKFYNLSGSHRPAFFHVHMNVHTIAVRSVLRRL